MDMEEAGVWEGEGGGKGGGKGGGGKGRGGREERAPYGLLLLLLLSGEVGGKGAGGWSKRCVRLVEPGVLGNEARGEVVGNASVAFF
jgi:hypothetical protein